MKRILTIEAQVLLPLLVSCCLQGLLALDRGQVDPLEVLQLFDVEFQPPVLGLQLHAGRAHWC